MPTYSINVSGEVPITLNDMVEMMVCAKINLAAITSLDMPHYIRMGIWRIIRHDVDIELSLFLSINLVLSVPKSRFLHHCLLRTSVNLAITRIGQFTLKVLKGFIDKKHYPKHIKGY